MTVLDGHSHTCRSWPDPPVRGSHLGVSNFGQSGDLKQVYRYHRIAPDSIVAVGLDVR